MQWRRDQVPVFEAFQPIRQNIYISSTIKLDKIYGIVNGQLEVIYNIEKIYDIRTLMKKDILPPLNKS